MEQCVQNVMSDAGLTKLLQGIIDNQMALAEAGGVVLPFTQEDAMTILSNVHARGKVELPVLLRGKMLDEHAFDQAVEAGYIVAGEEGRLVWTLGNQSLLAYFLGKLYCGDRAVESRRKKGALWARGKGVFPATALGELFGVKNLKHLRACRFNGVLPQDYQLIEDLFDR